MNCRILPTLKLISTSAVLLAAVLAGGVFGGLEASGQSGRRAPKTSATPEPDPSPSPTPTVKKRAPTRLSLTLASEGAGGMSYIPKYFYDAAIQGCAGELENSPGVLVMSGNDMSHGEAIKSAKSSKETYVIWLELRQDSMSSSSSNSSQYSNILLNYTVYAPATAKVVAHGETYQRSARVGPVSTGPIGGSGSSDYVQYRLKEAGREAADLILGKLLVLVPPSKP